MPPYARSQPLALALVNTRVLVGGGVVDRLTTVEDLRAWLDEIEHDVRPLAFDSTPRLLRQLRRLRADLAVVMHPPHDGGEDIPRAVTRINRAAAGSPIAARLVLTPRGLHTDRQGGAATGERMVAAVAESFIDLVEEPGLSSLRVCASDECLIHFLDATGRRRWCSSSICGNRERVRRHYDRHKRIAQP